MNYGSNEVTSCAQNKGCVIKRNRSLISHFSHKLKVPDNNHNVQDHNPEEGEPSE